MKPIAEEDSSKILIVVRSGRAINDQWTEKSISVLEGEVRVIPRSTAEDMLVRASSAGRKDVLLVGFEPVSQSVAWRNRALRNSWDSIIL